MEGIIAGAVSAAITGFVTLAVCLINNRYQSNSTKKLIEYKLDELTKKVEKHNNVIERVYRLEQRDAVHEEQIKVANHRIDDLEKAQ